MSPEKVVADEVYGVPLAPCLVTKALELMTQTYGPHMRVADTVLDLDKEANPTSNAMYRILQNKAEWTWPNEAKHLMAWNDDRGECVQEQGESAEDYLYRAFWWHQWPNYRTGIQAQWLRCAMITSRALKYLYQYHTQGESLRIRSQAGLHPTYDSRRFYEYVWICLNQGYGTRVWKTEPPMPSVTEQNVDFWFMATAQRLVDETVKAWEAGTDLDILIPIPTLRDLLPSPLNEEALEALAEVWAKLKALELAP
ncbi:hypothetical protein F4803DRAFT_556758 [Xylaria telfairii]|nr:hypothetical protein F4803DRAFT_556758 [Xylaria telfairii]